MASATTFQFRAMDLAGATSAGEIEAESKAAVGEQLRQRGLIVLDVSEKSTPFAIEDVFKRWKGVDKRELAVFSRQFATLVASGMPMLRTLQTLEDQTQDEMITEAIAGVRSDVEAGSSLEKAMERYPKVFDRLYRAMVRSGEQSGRLDEVLDRIAFQVEKQDALMRERDLAGPRTHAAAGQCRHARRVMGSAERPARGQRAAFDLAGDGGDHRYFQQFGRRQWRQDRRQARRQHRLAGAGRTDHQEVMAASRRDFQGALGALLALDVAEVESRGLLFVDLRLRARQHLRALEMVGDLDQRIGRHDLQIRARPGGFRAAGRRADQALVARIGADRGGQHARHRRDRSIET